MTKKYITVKRTKRGWIAVLITKKLWKDKKRVVDRPRDYKLHAHLDAIRAAERFNVPIIL